MSRSQVPSEVLQVGDVVRVHRDAEIPLDMALLASSDEKGAVYVQVSVLIHTLVAAFLSISPAHSFSVSLSLLSLSVSLSLSLSVSF